MRPEVIIILLVFCVGSSIGINLAAPALALIGSVMRKYCECLPVANTGLGGSHWTALHSALSKFSVLSKTGREAGRPSLACTELAGRVSRDS